MSFVKSRNIIYYNEAFDSFLVLAALDSTQRVEAYKYHVLCLKNLHRKLYILRHEFSLLKVTRRPFRIALFSLFTYEYDLQSAEHEGSVFNVQV